MLNFFISYYISMAQQNIITKNVVVELREKNSNKNTVTSSSNSTNGDYTVMLPKDIDIEEGDLVSVQSVFIDDDGENENSIIIEEDIVDGEISGFLYCQDNNTSQTEANTTSAGAVTGRTLGDERTYHPGFNADAAQRLHPDGQNYFLSSIDDASTADGLKTCQSITFAVNMLINKGSPVPVFFKYGTVAGQTIKKTVVWDYTTIEKIQSSGGFIKINNSLMARRNKKDSDSFQFPFDFNGNLSFDQDDRESVKQMVVGGVQLGSPLTFESENLETGHICSLIKKTVKFSLKAGSYKPEHISQLITDQMVKISPSGFISGQSPERFTNNEFFTTSLDLKQIGDKANGDNAGTRPFWIRADGAKALQFDDTDIGGGVRRNYWCGASNFGLSYDGIRFGFTNLHNSIFHSKLPSVVGTLVGNRDSSGSQYLANKVGGICFSSLSPPDFWFNKLGFNRDMMVHPKRVTCGWQLPGTHGGAGVNPVGNVAFTATTADSLDNRIVDGENSTGDLNSVDSIVVRDDTPDTSRGNGAYDIPGNAGLSGVNTAITSSIGILAGELNQQEEGKSYYQIEIDMNVPSEKHGSNSFNNKIQAIIGRYFTSGNGTQSVGGEGAITYSHKGMPIKLNQFRVRILSPDGTLARVGDDNTVFVNVTKAK
jgi:hypothetical protein|tara:strand:+ start:1099 stop:3060 length:1962 start_codon:yes stop_codon:yes gene_type:complete